MIIYREGGGFLLEGMDYMGGFLEGQVRNAQALS